MPDRRKARGKRHGLPAARLVTRVAILCGARLVSAVSQRLGVVLGQVAVDDLLAR